jgi:anti-sigma regulatory factor (Ser/Thr protein kinase)
MEMILGWLHAVFPVDDNSRIGEARRHASELAHELAWDELERGRLALVVTELGSNLLRHAHRGRLLIAALPASGEIEVLSIDRGPGIANLDQCMGDGFSTGSTPGTGLGAVRRLAHSFDIHSSTPEGTVVVARLRNQRMPALRSRAIDIGAVSLAAPGETACGDAWAACLDGPRAAVMLADGLGHGPDAAMAALAATAVFRDEPFADPRAGLQQAHEALRSTRGVALARVQLDSTEQQIRSVGAGNVLVRVVSGDSDRTVLSQHGTLGLQIRRPEEVRTDWPPHAVVVLHTDGIEGRWTPQLIHPVLGHDPALVAAVLVRDHCRGRDDASVVVLRRRG